MLEDKFKLSKVNIMLIVVNVFLVIITLLAGIQLITSLKSSSNKIPDLETTAGKSSTREADATTTTSEETTTTTTKKKGNETSPYYNLDLSSILSEDLVTNKGLNKDEKMTLGKQYFKVLEGVFEGTDDDLINVSHILTKAKPGEIDKISVDGHDYGIIYNGKEFFKTIFTSRIIYNELEYFNYNGVKAIYLNSDGNYYKLAATKQKKTYEITDYQFIPSANSNEYTFKALYYDTDYKERGLKKPETKSINIFMAYSSTSGRWMIDSFNFPDLEG